MVGLLAFDEVLLGSQAGLFFLRLTLFLGGRRLLSVFEIVHAYQRLKVS